MLDTIDPRNLVYPILSLFISEALLHAPSNRAEKSHMHALRSGVVVCPRRGAHAAHFALNDEQVKAKKSRLLKASSLPGQYDKAIACI